MTDDDSLTERITAALATVVRFIVLAVAWVLSVVWLLVATVWDAIVGDPEAPEDEE